MEERTIEEAFFPDGWNESKPALKPGEPGTQEGAQGEKQGAELGGEEVKLDWGGREADPGIEEHIADLMNDGGLTQDGAQKYLDAIIEEEKRLTEREEQWAKEIEREFPGVEQKQETMVRCSHLMHEFGNQDLLNFIDEAGLSNHPGMIKMFTRMSKALYPDLDWRQYVKGEPKSLDEKMFPGLKPKQEAKQPVSPGGPRTVAETFFPDGWQDKRGNQ